MPGRLYLTTEVWIASLEGGHVSHLLLILSDLIF